MKKPSQMSEGELADIAGHVQDWLYYDTGTPIDAPNRYGRHAVDAEGFVKAMDGLLSGMGMAPPGAEELEQSRKHEEFSKFLDQVVKDVSPGTEVYLPVHHDTAAALEGTGLIVDDGETMSAYVDEPTKLTKKPADEPTDLEHGEESNIAAGEEIRRGDLVCLIDGKARLADRDEAVKRLLTEFRLWSGGFDPAECSDEERNTFLCNRDLDAAQESAMWPERHPTDSPEMIEMMVAAFKSANPKSSVIGWHHENIYRHWTKDTRAEWRKAVQS